jgi:ComEC/Rec2-related protein
VKDCRLLPIAAALWATTFVCEGISTAYLAIVALIALCVTICICVAGFFTRNASGSRSILCQSAAVVATVVVGISLCYVNQVSAESSALYRAAESKSSVRIIGAVTTAPTASWKLGADCQFTVTTEIIDSRSVLSSSFVQALVFASGRSCSVSHGAEYRFDGQASVAQFGTQPVWMDVGEDSIPQQTTATSSVDSLFSTMADGFAKVTQQLPQQARVLVPGLTIGVVGQDLLSQSQTIDAGFGAQVETQFKDSGIMHLMAVSGGHFVLAAMIAKRIGGLFRLKRLLRVLLALAAVFVLSQMVYPSDSVCRAVVTGVIGAAALLVGRKVQPISALCWCVIIVLITNPAMAKSFGFALSCAAVIGIIVIGAPLSKYLAQSVRFLPAIVTEGFALSLGAQFATLPIQIAMSGQVPMLSLPANVIVAPFVSFATVFGLLSFLVSWLLPALGLAFAWIAGTGTYVMYITARFFGNSAFVLSIGSNPAAVSFVCAVAQCVLVLLVWRILSRRRSASFQPVS